MHHGRRRQRPAVVEVNGQGRSSANRCRVIEVLLGHIGVVDRDISSDFIEGTGGVQTRANVALAESMRTGNVINVSAVVLVVAHQTQRHTVTQRDIHETFRQVT